MKTITRETGALAKLVFYAQMAPALASALGPLVFLVLTATAHLLDDNHDWVTQSLSQLTLGPSSTITVTSFALPAGLTIVLALKLESGIRGGGGKRTSIIFMILIGVGFLFIGIFPTDPEGVPLTFHNLVHQGTVRIIAALFPAACFFIAPSMRGDERWRRFFRYTMVTGALALALDMVWFAVPEAVLHPRLGLYQRLLATNALAWMEVLSINLLALANHKAEPEAKALSRDMR